MKSCKFILIYGVNAYFLVFYDKYHQGLFFITTFLKPFNSFVIFNFLYKMCEKHQKNIVTYDIREFSIFIGSIISVFWDLDVLLTHELDCLTTLLNICIHLSTDGIHIMRNVFYFTSVILMLYTFIIIY